MKEHSIDLRSDTVTQPSPEMRQAIAHAEVGDDVLGLDPTVGKLQNLTAELLGKEAAIYMPSGSMTNQIAIRLHCSPGEEFLCESGCHIYNYEQAAYAQLSGVAAQTVQGNGGVLEWEQLEGLIRPDDDHIVRTKLVTLENTHNRGAGRIQPYETVKAICAWAKRHALKTHLDGARLFNAVVATGIPAAKWAAHFDTVSICFSKGLGAPVGSALAGDRGTIRTARRMRKLFGGGMRQAGIIAAGALYALKNNIDRLAEDHEKARILAEAVRATDGLELTPEHVDSNMVIVKVDSALGSAAEFAARLEEQKVLTLPISSNQIRAVTHLDVSLEDVRQAVDILQKTAQKN